MMTACAGPEPRVSLPRVARRSMASLGACLITAAALLLASGCFAHSAWAQVESREGIALQNQILELRAQIQALQNQIGRGGGSSYGGGYSSPPPPSSGGSDLVAQLLSRVSTLEDQVRQLRGQVDQTQNQVQRQGADLGKRIDDLSFQVQNPQGGLPPATGAVPPRPTSPPPPNLQPAPLQLQPGAPPPPPPPPGSFSGAPPPGQPPVPTGPVKRTPELAMQEGNAALARRDYANAEQAAREVLNNYRTSPRAYDAQFLLAQALIGERQYSQAAIAYDDTYNRARKGAHAPEALLGLADSLIAINERKAACDTLTKLRMEYPVPRPDLRDAIASASQRSGCR
jgi:TolA-binding protein